MGSEVQVLSNRKNIFIFSLKIGHEKKPETVHSLWYRGFPVRYLFWSHNMVTETITHLSKHATVAGEGLCICPHMSSYVSICLCLSQSGHRNNNAFEQARHRCGGGTMNMSPYVVICLHMSPYVPVCPNLVMRQITHLSKHISKALQNLCFQAESARVSPKKVNEKRYEKLYRGALLRQY